MQLCEAVMKSELHVVCVCDVSSESVSADKPPASPTAVVAAGAVPSDCHSSEYQAGDHQSGDYQSGDYQAGDYQSSYYQSGDYQAGDQSVAEVDDDGDAADQTSIWSVDEDLLAAWNSQPRQQPDVNSDDSYNSLWNTSVISELDVSAIDESVVSELDVSVADESVISELDVSIDCSALSDAVAA